jgi:hypothetical protein
MTRKYLPRLLAATVTLAALTAAATLFAGSSFAGGSAAEANYLPQNTAAPQISGTAQVGQTLSVSTGSWMYQSTPTFTYQWSRCNEVGKNCSTINGATASTYVVQGVDGSDTLMATITAQNAQGSASANSNLTAVVPLANPGPKNTAAPSVSGNAQVGQTLSASTGSWTYSSATTFSFLWLRCDSNGNSCANIGGASSSNAYAVQSADSGHRLRVAVTASNAQGSATATSGATNVVGGAPAPTPAPTTAGAIKLGNGKTSVLASSVVLPDRLVIDGVQFQPRRLTSRAPFLARFHVSDTNGNVVRDALVYALGAPYAWLKGGVEVATDQNGWATITLTPSDKMPLGRGSLLLFIRARVQGQDPLAGASSRRLVNILIRP